MVSDVGIQQWTQLLHTFCDFATAVDIDGHVDAIIFKFAKAFDSVSYCKLLYKLKQVFKNVCLLRWINSYLEDRQHNVIVGKAESIEMPVLSGASKGSVLGPLLCLSLLMICEWSTH